MSAPQRKTERAWPECLKYPTWTSVHKLAGDAKIGNVGRALAGELQALTYNFVLYIMYISLLLPTSSIAI